MTTNDNLENAFPQMIRTLDKSRRDILTKTQMQQLVTGNAEEWNLNQRGVTTARVINFLWEKQQLKEYVFEFPSRKETRYTIGDITEFELAQSLKPNSYIVHKAAMYINNLTDKTPDIIHINVEQLKHHQRNRDSLTQESIDRAFQKSKSRISNEIAESNGIRVCVTHGQRTDGLGVIKRKGPNGEIIRVTNIERTLVDITVRPIYAGGVEEVLKAYTKAKELLSVKKLAEILQKMDYVYPYHQLFGFYLEKSGVYNKKDIQIFEEIPMNFDFYLDYKMPKPKYSEKWKVFYPSNL